MFEQPLSLTHLTEVELHKLFSGESPPWTAEDGIAALAHQLAAPLLPDLATVPQVTPSMIAEIKLRAGVGSIFDHLTSQAPLLVVLEGIKQFGRHVRHLKDSPLYGEPGAVLYYAAIAAAFLKLDAGISQLGPSEWKAAFGWAAEYDGARSLAPVFVGALAKIEAITPTRSAMRSRSGFTLIELLVTICIISILIALMVPSLSHARAASRQAACGTNLRTIGQAMQAYASTERVFPTQPPPASSKFGKWSTLPPPTGNIGEDPIFSSYYNNGTPASPNYQCGGDPLANAWLLVLQQGILPRSFICPSDPTAPKSAPTTFNTPGMSDYASYLNFSKGTYSYAFAYPWTSTTGTVAVWWRGGNNASTVIAADIGPALLLPQDNPNGTPGSAASNSKNHGGHGQQVLFADSHVEFSKKNTIDTGVDNIYAADHGAISVKNGGAQFTSTTNLNKDPNDIILAPGRTE